MNVAPTPTPTSPTQAPAGICPGSTGLPVSSGRHSGCRTRFGPDGRLYIGTGDAATATNPQDPSSLGGKVLRVHDARPQPGPMATGAQPGTVSILGKRALVATGARARARPTPAVRIMAEAYAIVPPTPRARRTHRGRGRAEAPAPRRDQ